MVSDKNHFLKECIADALFKLMKTKNINKISIDEIIQTAGVGRMTYFRNFTSKAEVVFFKLESLSKRYYEQLPVQPANDREAVEHFIRWVYFAREEISQLNRQSPIYLLAYFSLRLPSPPDAIPEHKYKTAFYVYGATGLIQKWADESFRDPPEVIIGYLDTWVQYDKFENK